MAQQGPRLHRLFYTPLLEVDLSGEAGLIEALKSAIEANRANSQGVTRSNVGGWHSDTDMLRWGGEPALKLGRHVMENALQHTNDNGARGNQPRFVFNVEMWANVSPPGASNEAHAHPNAFWSAVFFVDDGGAREDGHLVLLDPRFPLAQMYNSDLVFVDDERRIPESSHRVTPTPGKLVIFPSWLVHLVRPHSGPRDRISIAINVVVSPAPPPQQRHTPPPGGPRFGGF